MPGPDSRGNCNLTVRVRPPEEGGRRKVSVEEDLGGPGLGGGPRRTRVFYTGTLVHRVTPPGPRVPRAKKEGDETRGAEGLSQRSVEI